MMDALLAPRDKGILPIIWLPSNVDSVSTSILCFAKGRIYLVLFLSRDTYNFYLIYFLISKDKICKKGKICVPRHQSIHRATPF